MLHIKQLMLVYGRDVLNTTIGFLGILNSSFFIGFSYVHASDEVDVSGMYVSDITGKSDYDTFFGNSKHRKLELAVRQDGAWIIAIDTKFGTRVSGFRDGDTIQFEVEPGEVISYYNAFGEWNISADGSSLEGTWKGDGGSYKGAGKWRLKKTGDLKSANDMPVLSNEVSFSDLVFKDGNGDLKKYSDLVSNVPVADFNQNDLPRKSQKIKSLPDELMWLKAHDIDQNDKVDQKEMCQVWLIKLAELRTGNNYSDQTLRAVSQGSISPKQGLCVPLAHRKAVYKQIVQALSTEDTELATAKDARSLLNHLAPGSISNDKGGDGGGGGGGSM